jgi:hypothetical protein
MKMRMVSLEYSKVTGNFAVQADLVNKIKTVVATKMGSNYNTGNIDVTLSPGSLYAIVKITPPSGIDASDVKTKAMQEKTNIQTEATTQVKTISNIATVTTTGNAADISVTSEDPVVMQTVSSAATSTTQASAAVTQAVSSAATSTTQVSAVVAPTVSSAATSTTQASASSTTGNDQNEISGTTPTSKVLALIVSACWTWLVAIPK